MRFVFSDCAYDSGTREVTKAGRVLPLSPKALLLLDLLIRRRPNAVAKQEVHEHLWPGTFVSDASVGNVIAELRAALGDDARSPQIIRTVHRFGYAFRAAVQTGALGAERATPSSVECRLVRDGSEIHLRPGENLIGRDSDVVVWIDDSAVSRRHARILVGEDGAVLEDLNSKNGTKVRGRRISGIERLEDRDEIAIGPATLVFRIFRRTGPTDSAVDEPSS
jgi:DNA-binding winged helix-turn-helix (wHTH) protein